MLKWLLNDGLKLILFLSIIGTALYFFIGACIQIINQF